MTTKVKAEEKWFNPKIHSGWDKHDSASIRRQKALKAHKGDKLATARALTALANVTTDKQTKKLAREDAQYFYKLIRKG